MATVRELPKGEFTNKFFPMHGKNNNQEGQKGEEEFDPIDDPKKYGKDKDGNPDPDKPLGPDGKPIEFIN